MDLKGKGHPMRRSVHKLFSDQIFLLNFIMSTYLGPDVKADEPRCSAVQRLVAGLLPYTLSDLGPSYVSISLLEKLYYYLLRDAHPDLVLELRMLHLYLKGSLFLQSTALTEGSQQFTSFFPLIFHKQIWYPEGFRIIKGIAFIDDPVMSFIEEGDIDRFKSLTGLSSLKVDIDVCLRVQLDHRAGREGELTGRNIQETIPRREGPHAELEQQGGKEGEHDSMNNGQETTSNAEWLHVGLDQQEGKKCEHIDANEGQETISSGECLHVDLDHQVGKGSEHDSKNGECPSRRFQQTHKRQRVNSPPIPMFPHVLPTKHNNKKDPPERISKSNGPTVMPLLSIPDLEDFDLDSSLLLTGTARRALFGPSVGVVDIGTSKVAYLFRVSLPGVKKDYCQFSCEVESDGKVHIRGVTSGGGIIVKQARVFEMKFRQLCSPGPFTLSFSLPGPVDPRLFSPNFRSDGIFEAVVIKAQQPL